MPLTVSIKWLLARLYEPDLVIIDCRFWLNNPEEGLQQFIEAHIPRAVYLDLDKDLSVAVQEHGGRHPLPDVPSMVKLFSKAGISQDTRVVIYDDNNGMIAARVWWMLKYLGHEQVFVMEQGFTAWRDASFPVSQDQPMVIPASFEANVRQDWIVAVEDVRNIVEQNHSNSIASDDISTSSSITGLDNEVKFDPEPTIIIDSREHRRYAGLEEPIDSKAGHIPGAVNYFWQDVLQENGSFKSKEGLQQHFAKLVEASPSGYDTPIIVYCGSGVSACPNVLALIEAGFTNVKLYAGSWSDWILYEGNPIATGKEV